MSEEERQALLDQMKATTEQAKSMTRAEAQKRLQREGLLDEKGRSTAPVSERA
jgi:hypothetical protein